MTILPSGAFFHEVQPHVFLGVIGSCHNDLCRCAAMDGIVHLVLNRGEEILCGLAIKRVVHSGGVNIRDFLVKAPLTGPNLLNLGNQVVEVVLIKICPLMSLLLSSTYPCLVKVSSTLVAH